MYKRAIPFCKVFISLFELTIYALSYLMLLLTHWDLSRFSSKLGIEVNVILSTHPLHVFLLLALRSKSLSICFWILNVHRVNCIFHFIYPSRYTVLKKKRKRRFRSHFFRRYWLNINTHHPISEIASATLNFSIKSF